MSLLFESIIIVKQVLFYRNNASKLNSEQAVVSSLPSGGTGVTGKEQR